MCFITRLWLKKRSSRIGRRTMLDIHIVNYVFESKDTKEECPPSRRLWPADRSGGLMLFTQGWFQWQICQGLSDNLDVRLTCSSVANTSIEGLGFILSLTVVLSVFTSVLLHYREQLPLWACSAVIHHTSGKKTEHINNESSFHAHEKGHHQDNSFTSLFRLLL